MKHNKWQSILHNEEGGALVLALMVLLVLSTLGLALGTVTIGSMKLGDNSRDHNSAYYIAEAGANMAYEELKKEVTAVYESSNSTSEQTFFDGVDNIGIIKNGAEYGEGDFASQSGKQPQAEVEIIKNEDGNYVIESTGIINGRKRVVEKPVTMNWIPKKSDGNITYPIPPSGKAIIFGDTVKLVDQNKVHGDLLYVGPKVDNPKEKVILGWESTYNNISHNESIQLEHYSVNLENTIKNLTFPTIPKTLMNVEINSKNELFLTKDSFLKNLNLEYQKNIEINVPNNDVYLIIDNLILKEKNKINVKGSGTLNILVKNDIKLGFGTEIKNTNNESRVNIIHLNNKEMELQQDSKIIGDLIKPNGNIIIGYEVNINGDIITGSGNTTIKQKARIIGDVLKLNGNIVIASEVNIFGDIVTGDGDITIANDSKTSGRIHTAKGNLILGARLRHNGDIINGSGKTTFIQDNHNINGIIISNGEILLGHQVTINGVIYSNGHNIEIKDGSKINGAIISGMGNTKIWQNSILTGVIVANNIEFLYGTKITYSNNYLEYLENETSNKEVDINIKDLIIPYPATEK